MESLSFQYPTYYLIGCLILGLLYAAFLYYRDDSFRETGAWLKALLGGLRFFVVATIATLLLSPLLKSLLTETKKPVVILAQDVSESIAAKMDSTVRLQYAEDFRQLSTELSEKYEVKEYAFGSEVREGVDFNFSDKVSNLSEMLTNLYDLYSNQNLGAVILASDGVYNEGSNPVYAGTKLTAPIYTVALGDTTPQRDLILKRVFHNEIAYLGDKFSIQVDVTAQNCTASATSLIVSKIENGKTNRLQQIPININRNDFFTTQEIILDANKAGVQRYRISLAPVANEVTTANNSKDIFVDVLDARQKILILANSPHPDLTALKQSIGTNKNYEVTVQYADDPAINIAAFDFVVLHQLPSAQNQIVGVLNQLNGSKKPRLFIVGQQTDLRLLNQAQSLLSINGDGRNINEVQARIAPNFSNFTIEERILSELPKFPPLVAPFGEFKAGNADILLMQRIGKVDTQYPLLVVGEPQEIKTGVLAAEGVWKWRLFDYLQNKNFDVFDEILGKTVQYLTLKEDKRKFRVSLSKNIFNENEPIIFDAELYNDSYERVNEPDASLVITNSEGKDFNYTFNKTTNGYTLNARIFPVGNYRFRSTVFSNGESLTYNGQFSVQPVQLELYETTANHGLLRLLSEKYGGEVVYPADLTSIGTRIADKGNVKPVIYQTSKTRSVINLKWLFFLLASLLTVEWFLRRYFGGY